LGQIFQLSECDLYVTPSKRSYPSNLIIYFVAHLWESVPKLLSLVFYSSKQLCFITFLAVKKSYFCTDINLRIWQLSVIPGYRRVHKLFLDIEPISLHYYFRGNCLSCSNCCFYRVVKYDQWAGDILNITCHSFQFCVIKGFFLHHYPVCLRLDIDFCKSTLVFIYRLQ